MKYFNTHLDLEQIKSVAIQTKAPAVFDADGTLWEFDLGESFFQYQIEHRDKFNKSGKPWPQDPWKHYRDLKKISPPQAFRWLAAVNEGWSLLELRQEAAAFVKSLGPLPIFPSQRDLITWFIKESIPVYVVTASVTWAIEPGAKQLGVYDVLGVESKVHGDLITSEDHGVVTWGQGKAERFLQATKGIPPFFAAGNTLGDQHLLEISTHFRVAVNSASPSHPLYESEQELFRLAQLRGWITVNSNA